jgi:Zn-dependent peptidase ImmA (M78 family)
MMATANPKMIELARTSRGLSQTDFAKTLGMLQSTYSRVEAGLLAAADELIDRIAAALDYPRDFFFLDEQIHGAGTSALHYVYRRKQGLPARTLRRIEAEANIGRIRIKRLLANAQVRTPHTIPTFNIDDFKGDVERIAVSVRAMWLLPRGPIESMTAAIEAAGGLVIRQDFGTDSVDATSFRFPNMPPLFFVNRALRADRQRYTLAHELAHLVMHPIPNPNMEEQADRFAAEFLMPKDEIKPSLHQFSLAKAANLKPYWKVSMWALIRRAFDLRTITESQYRYLSMRMSAMGYRKQEPLELDFPVEEPKVYQGLIDVHLKKLGYSLEDLSKLLVANVEVLQQQLSDPRSRLRLVS